MGGNIYTGEAQAGVASIDHATQLSAETMRIMKAKSIPAVLERVSFVMKGGIVEKARSELR